VGSIPASPTNSIYNSTSRDGIQASAVTIPQAKLVRSLAVRAVVFFVIAIGASPLAPASTPPKDARAFVRDVVANELAADATDHSLWMYRDDNKVPGAHSVKLVIETSQGDLSRTIERDGHPLTPQAQQEDEQKIDDFVHDADLRQRQKRRHQQDSEKANSLTKMLPDAFLWTFTKQNGDETALRFEPDPHFRPPTREARVFAAMAGVMVVNTRQKRIQELKGKLTQDVNFGYGLLGKLQKGGTFEIERQQIAPGVWNITATHIHIQGHALIFKSIGEQQDEVTGHYHPTSQSLGLAAAAQMLKDGTAARTLQ
jgi:hypothetical protein